MKNTTIIFCGAAFLTFSYGFCDLVCRIEHKGEHPDLGMLHTATVLMLMVIALQLKGRK